MKLYIRFFDDKTKEIPVNSEIVRNSYHELTNEELVWFGLMVQDWMKKYPTGKVDYRWL